jgi:hypothetical protein
VRRVAFVDMSNVLNEAKKQQVLALGRLGWPLRRIEQETGVRRETAGAYLKAARIGVRPPGVWGRRPPAKPANANEVTTGFGVESTGLEVENPKRIPSASACEPFREAIALGLSRGRDATAIWQDLVGRKWVRRGLSDGQALRAQVAWKPATAATRGDRDGTRRHKWTTARAMVRDPQNRKYRRRRLFVMVLGCSRKAARFLTFRSSSLIWAELHEKASRRLGGATRVVVLDNLREGVLVPDIYDPTLNPLSIATSWRTMAQSPCPADQGSRSTP